jgi:hypothetical protein
LTDTETPSDDCRRHIDLIIEFATDIRSSCHPDVRKVFERAVAVLE